MPCYDFEFTRHSSLCKDIQAEEASGATKSWWNTENFFEGVWNTFPHDVWWEGSVERVLDLDWLQVDQKIYSFFIGKGFDSPPPQKKKKKRKEKRLSW